MELSTLLERLQMVHLLTRLESICEQAAKGDLDYHVFLARALETEWRGRQQRGIEIRLRMTRLPWLKTLEQFDFECQPSIDRKVVRDLAGLSFVERAENVTLLGPPGVGKTHLAIALGIKAVEAGSSVLFLTLEAMMGRLVRARHENRLDRTLQQLVSSRLMILDELGYLPLSREEASLFFPAPGPPLRTRESERHQQQELCGLGRDLQRPCPRHGDSRSASAPRHDHEH